MCPHQQANCFSDDSNGSNIKSCFNTEDEKSDSDTNPIDVNTDIKRDNKADISWLLDENKDYLLEYYFNQKDKFDESDVIALLE